MTRTVRLFLKMAVNERKRVETLSGEADAMDCGGKPPLSLHATFIQAAWPGGHRTASQEIQQDDQRQNHVRIQKHDFARHDSAFVFPIGIWTCGMAGVVGDPGIVGWWSMKGKSRRVGIPAVQGAPVSDPARRETSTPMDCGGNRGEPFLCSLRFLLFKSSPAVPRIGHPLPFRSHRSRPNARA
jgi:hypothetical protein